MCWFANGPTRLFFHRIVPGGTDKSYGIHVARLAGIPRPVIHRARELLEHLEIAASAQSPRTAPDSLPGPKAKKEAANGSQMMLFSQPTNHLADYLNSLDLDHLSPTDALKTLKELQEKTKGN